MLDSPATAAVSETQFKDIFRVLIVDDHDLLRAGLKELLSMEANLEICGEAADEAEALELVRSTSPHLVIVDVALKEGDGIDLVKRIRSLNSATLAIVYSMYDESLFAERAVRAGASGYVHKQAPARTVLEAVRAVLAGNIFLSSAMMNRLVCGVTRSGERTSASPIESLSDREVEVLRCIGRGQTTSQIAKLLHVSPRTVESHRARVKKKLNLKTAVELHRYAVQWMLENG